MSVVKKAGSEARVADAEDALVDGSSNARR
jgi:hypothetical protein